MPASTSRSTRPSSSARLVNGWPSRPFPPIPAGATTSLGPRNGCKPICREWGFPVVEVWPTGKADSAGHPTVFAEWPAGDPAAPAVLIYGHHDVQPVEPLAEWDTPPFEPVQRGGLLFGRGSSDDKGQVLFHALGLRAA